MIQSNTLIENQVPLIGNFPSDLIDPKLKGQKWCHQYNEAIHGEWSNGLGSIQQTRRTDWIETRKYGEGNQSTTKYQKWWTVATKGGKRMGFANLDWSIVSIIPKYKDAVLGYLSKFNHSISIEAQDEMSVNQKELYKFQIWAEKELMPKFQEVEQKAGRKLDEYKPPFIPESKEELEIFMENQGLKLPEEISFEDAIGYVLYLNDWNQIEDKVREDMFECGLGATRTYKDLKGRVRVRYVDPVNLIAGTTRRKDFKNIRYVGELVTMTIGELKMEAGDQFTENEYAEIANMFAGRLNNRTTQFNFEYINTDDLGNYPWDNYNITVLDAQFRTVDRVYTERRKIPNRSKKHVSIKNYGYRTDHPDSEINLTDIDIVYGCKSIVGTRFCYDWGKVEDIYRSKDDLSEADFDFTIYKSHNKAIEERMLTFADAIQNTWLKIQNLKAKARPSGAAIDMSALEGVVVGGHKMSEEQVIQIFEQTGILRWSSNTAHYKDLNKGGTIASPVLELKGGLGSEFPELLADLNNNVLMIQRVSGLNETMDASNIDPNNPVGTTKIAQAASHNTLKPILDGVQKIKEETFKRIACKLQLTAKYGGMEKYQAAIGPIKVKYIENFTRKSLASYGLKVVPQPTEEMKNQIQSGAMEAMRQRATSGKGGIDFPDYLFVMRIVNTGNLKLAEALLSHRIYKKIEYDNATAERLSMVNAQASAQAAQMAAEAETKKDRDMTMNKIMLEQAKTKLKIMQDNNKSLNTIRENAAASGMDILKMEEEYKEKNKMLLNELEASFNEVKYQVDHAPKPQKAA